MQPQHMHTRAGAHERDAAAAAVHVRNLVGCAAERRTAGQCTRLCALQAACSGGAPCIARLTVLHTEHCTLEAPRIYMSSVLQPPHSSCAISVPAQPQPGSAGGTAAAAPRAQRNAPAGGTGVMLLHCGAAAGGGTVVRRDSWGRPTKLRVRAGRWDAGAVDAAVGLRAPVRSARSTRPAGAPGVRRDQVRTGKPPTVATAAAKPVARAPPPCLRVEQQRAAAGAYDLTLRRTAACEGGTVGLRSIRPRLVRQRWRAHAPCGAAMVLAAFAPRAGSACTRRQATGGTRGLACGHLRRAAPAPCALRRLAGVAATASRRRSHGAAEARAAG